MPERSGAGAAAIIDAGRVAELIARERAAYGDRHPSSRQTFAAAGANLLGGVPMTWMRPRPKTYLRLCAEAELRRALTLPRYEPPAPPGLPAPLRLAAGLTRPAASVVAGAARPALPLAERTARALRPLADRATRARSRRRGSPRRGPGRAAASRRS